MVCRMEFSGRALRAERERQDKSRAWLAVTAGVGVEYVGKLERGEHDPGASVVAKLAIALDVPLEALFTSSDNGSAAA